MLHALEQHSVHDCCAPVSRGSSRSSASSAAAPPGPLSSSADAARRRCAGLATDAAAASSLLGSTCGRKLVARPRTCHDLARRRRADTVRRLGRTTSRRCSLRARRGRGGTRSGLRAQPRARVHRAGGLIELRV